MNGLDLFSGIGGISLALSPWVKTVAYCESDKYAQGVLLSRMASRELDIAPIWDDVKTLTGLHLPRVDILSGGFPCQDISLAGAGEGLGGKRSGLFFEVIRLVKEISPRFVFLENVPAIRTRGLREVIRAFTEIGYDCRWTCLSASSIGAPHKRERWFLLAHTNCDIGSSSIRRGNEEAAGMEKFSREEYSSTGKLSGTSDNEWECPDKGYENSDRENPWATKPSVGRVADGIPFRLERLKCLGNSVVPAQARKAFEILSGIRRENESD